MPSYHRMVVRRTSGRPPAIAAGLDGHSDVPLFRAADIAELNAEFEEVLGSFEDFDGLPPLP